MCLASRRLSGNGPQLAWRGEPPGFSQVAAGALDLRRGPQGPALVTSGKACPHSSCSGRITGFLSRRCWGLRPCVESVPEPEDSSPVLTWILEYFWSLTRGVSPRLEWGHARAISSPAIEGSHASLCVDQGICGFPSILSHEAFPRGFPTGLSHVLQWCESILVL